MRASPFTGRPIIAVVRDDDTAVARAIAAAAADVLPAVELTYTVPGVSRLIAELRAHPRAIAGDTLIGAGTVCDAATAEQAIAAGAAFLVAPNFDAGVAAVAAAAAVPYVPGAFTPTEILAAAGAGCGTIKLFPASTLGTGFLAAMGAVAPHLRFVPTGGIAPADAASWFAAGAHAIGVGSSLNRAHRSGGLAAVTAEVAALAALAALAPPIDTTSTNGAPA